MIKRTIYIGNPSKLNVEKRQLKILNYESGVINSVPLEDIAIIEIDSPQIDLNSYLLIELNTYNIAVIYCKHHQPIGTGIALFSNSIHTKRILLQTGITNALKKKLWKTTIEFKIKNQAKVLELNSKEYKSLLKLSELVKTGDSTNMEARVARKYWKLLFGKDFKRGQFGDFPNPMLNYGYSIIRSAMTRAIVSAGLHPALGIKHKNQYNPYCLSDDLMEAYRPYLDEIAVELFQTIDEEDYYLSREIKKDLISVLYIDTKILGEIKPLMNSINITANSFVKSLEEKSNQLLFPNLWD